jgi:hypothetical protein
VSYVHITRTVLAVAGPKQGQTVSGDKRSCSPDFSGPSLGGPSGRLQRRLKAPSRLGDYISSLPPVSTIVRHSNRGIMFSTIYRLPLAQRWLPEFLEEQNPLVVVVRVLLPWKD